MNVSIDDEKIVEGFLIGEIPDPKDFPKYRSFIERQIKNPDVEVRKSILRYLEKAVDIHPNDVASILRKALDDKEWVIRKKIAEILGLLANNKPEIAFSIIKPLILDEVPYVRQSVIESLGVLAKYKPIEAITLIDQSIDVRSGYDGSPPTIESWLKETAFKSLGKAFETDPESTLPLVKKIVDKDIQVDTVSYWISPHFDVTEHESVINALRNPLMEMAKSSPMKTLAFLESIVSDERTYVRRSIVFALTEIAKVNNLFERVFLVLKTLLEDKDTSVRCTVIKSLGSLAHEHKERSVVFKELLKDKDHFVRSAVAAQLGILATSNPEFIPALASFAQDYDDSVRDLATDKLQEIYESYPEESLLLLRRYIDDENPSVLRNMLPAIKKLSIDRWEEAVPFVSKLVCNENAEIRAGLVSLLVEVAQRHPEKAYSILEKLSDDEDSYVRESVARAFGDVAEYMPKKALVQLRKSAQDPDPPKDYTYSFSDKNYGLITISTVRGSAAWALGKLAQYAPDEVVDVLENLARDNSALVRCLATIALTETGKYQPEKTISVLEKLANDSNEHVRYFVGTAVGNVAKEKRSQRLIEKLAEDHDKHVRESVARIVVVQALADPEREFILDKMIIDADREVRRSVAHHLKEMTKTKYFDRTLPFIEKMLSDPEGDVRAQATFFLDSVTTASFKRALPMLKKMATDSFYLVIYNLTGFLGKIAKEFPTETLNLLEQIIDYPDRLIQDRIAHSLEQIARNKAFRDRSLPLLKKLAALGNKTAIRALRVT